MLIKNGKIITMTGKTYENGCILIKEGKIINISESIEEKDERVIDAKGGWVIPGIIDAHCHVGMFEEGIGFEGADGNEMTDPVTPHLRAIDAINPMDSAFEDARNGGITTVMTGPGSANVIGGQFVVMKTYGVCIDDMVIKDSAAMKIAFGENPKRVYHGKGKSPSTRMATAGLLRETLVKAKNYIEKKNSARIKGDSFETDLKMEALIPVIQKKIPLKAHAHRADDILTAIRIAKEFDVNLTLEHCTEGEFITKYINKANVSAVVGPSLTSKTKVETRNKSFKTPGVLHKAGVKVAIMTDHPVIPIQYLPLCAGLAAKEGLGIDEALKAITINSAEIAGVDDRVGSIEIGKDADIAIFDGNPLEVFTNALYTIINGEVVYERES